MLLTPEQVQHIANLACIELTDGEIKNYCSQISAILDYVQQLQAVETEKILPTVSGVDFHGEPRTDQPFPGLELEDLLQNAADIKENQFRVPPVFD